MTKLTETQILAIFKNPGRYKLTLGEGRGELRGPLPVSKAEVKASREN